MGTLSNYFNVTALTCAAVIATPISAAAQLASAPEPVEASCDYCQSFADPAVDEPAVMTSYTVGTGYPDVKPATLLKQDCSRSQSFPQEQCGQVTAGVR